MTHIGQHKLYGCLYGESDCYQPEDPYGQLPDITYPETPEIGGSDDPYYPTIPTTPTIPTIPTIPGRIIIIKPWGDMGGNSGYLQPDYSELGGLVVRVYVRYGDGSSLGSYGSGQDWLGSYGSGSNLGQTIIIPGTSTWNR
ncbi:hypothetical protein OESDEN_03606 [Oesophagostomum dentatum]|uniref:Uncharacterized protein n=1 Tax=Oesophagostomum dentatum TaxID=61180 RepID=A0A0B1TFU3_OESDE|nr:hypothetical protein OESDEN_03606 [Oesophagostomum dentatum]